MGSTGPTITCKKDEKKVSKEGVCFLTEALFPPSGWFGYGTQSGTRIGEVCNWSFKLVPEFGPTKTQA